MDNKIFKLSSRVTVIFEAMPLGYYFPKVLVDGESMKIPLLFYDEDMTSVEHWLGLLKDLNEPLNLSYMIVSGALSYSQKYTNPNPLGD